MVLLVGLKITILYVKVNLEIIYIDITNFQSHFSAAVIYKY